MFGSVRTGLFAAVLVFLPVLVSAYPNKNRGLHASGDVIAAFQADVEEDASFVAKGDDGTGRHHGEDKDGKEGAEAPSSMVEATGKTVDEEAARHYANALRGVAAEKLIKELKAKKNTKEEAPQALVGGPCW